MPTSRLNEASAGIYWTQIARNENGMSILSTAHRLASHCVNTARDSAREDLLTPPHV